MGLRDLKQRAADRLQKAAPPLYRFMTREDRPWPFLRDVLGIALVLAVLGLVLWTYTGQPFPEAPVVVVESGSMMHCDNGIGIQRGADCDGPFGRLGTIDAGDLIFIKDVRGRADVATFLESRDGGREGYGMSGDVIVFARDGAEGTPIIHRAMFWLQVNDDGSFDIPAAGHFDSAQDIASMPVDAAEWRMEPSCLQSLASRLGNLPRQPDRSGFITMGDNNRCFDQAEGMQPVRPEWILGKARGEVPWIGVVKLQITDWFSEAGTDNVRTYVPGDVKLLTWLTVFALIGLPFVAEQVARVGRRRRDDSRLTRPPGKTKDRTTAMWMALVPGAAGVHTGSANGFVKGFLSQAGAIILLALALVGGNGVFIAIAVLVAAAVTVVNMLHAQDMAEDYNARPEA